MTSVIDVRGLTIFFETGNRKQRVVDDVTFSIDQGEVFGLVGESGCGKSTVAASLLGYRSNGALVERGEIWFNNQNLLCLNRNSLQRLRGKKIGFVPQNPTTSLNPSMSVGQQIAETLCIHTKASNAGAAVKAAELVNLVGLPNPRHVLQSYPHELSGGQQQRICIAIAVACEPDLIVLDEPTTGLDVTTQEQITQVLVGLRQRLGTAMLYVTHDLAQLAQIADRVGVMYAGHLVEVAPTRALYSSPRHPYTQGLIGSIIRIEDPSNVISPLRGVLRRQELPVGCPFSPRCEHAVSACARNSQSLEVLSNGHAVACQRWQEIKPAIRLKQNVQPREGSSANALLAFEGVNIAYGVRRKLIRWFTREVPVTVKNLTFEIGRNETFALVGESGSGKSTLARAISGLLPPISGRILFENKPLSALAKHRTNKQRQTIQYVFQNPDSTLNPRSRIKDILARPLLFFEVVRRAQVLPAVDEALTDVKLETAYKYRFPNQLSGGERQRVAIARALTANPELLICDEILSALDVSVQASVIELLRKLRDKYKVTLIFISHDLSVVRSLADRVGVLFRGNLMEVGSVEDVFEKPFHPYTYSLLRAVPRLNAREKTASRIRSQEDTIRDSKCSFAGRCPWRIEGLCIEQEPPWQRTRSGLAIRCHIPLKELAQLTSDLT